MAAPGRLHVELRDSFWAPRLDQLRDVTLPTLWDRFDEHGVLDSFRRLAVPDDRRAARRGWWFTDSDLAKWTEAATIAGRADLVDAACELWPLAQDDDGYLHTHFGRDGRARYADLDTGHELYCMGHFIEAAVSHHAATGDDRLLTMAVRVADHIGATFGPGRDERADLHPELELALCRLASATGPHDMVDLAAWMVEQPLRRIGESIDTIHPSGHAVRFLYLASGIAEVAAATGDARWRDAALRIWDELVGRHSYCTGAVGGRWMGEAIGRPYELDDETAYAESCAAVAMIQLGRRVWRLSGDPAVLDHIEVVLANALPAAIGDDGASWCYSNPQAFTGDGDTNAWVLPFEYGPEMIRQWFPPTRHPWFEVTCCPPNVARAFAQVPGMVAERDGRDLRVLLAVSSTIRDDEWTVHIEAGWPWSGEGTVLVERAPENGRLTVRVAGDGFVDIAPDGSEHRVGRAHEARWWAARPELASARGRRFLRRGPVVYALDDRDLPGVDLRHVVIDTGAPLDDSDPHEITVSGWVVPPRRDAPLYAVAVDPAADIGMEAAPGPARTFTFRPFHAWPNGTGQLRIWFPGATGG